MDTLLDIIKEQGLVKIIEEMCTGGDLKTCECCEKNILEYDILIEIPETLSCFAFCICKDCESELCGVEYANVNGETIIIEFETNDITYKYINNEEWVDNTNGYCFVCNGGRCARRTTDYDAGGSYTCCECDEPFCGIEEHYIVDTDGYMTIYCNECFVDRYGYRVIDNVEYIIEKYSNSKYNLEDVTECIDEECCGLDVHRDILEDIYMDEESDDE